MLDFLTAAPPWALAERNAADEGAAVQEIVQQVLAGKTRLAGRGERRRDVRVPFPYLVRLAPVAADGNSPAGESIVVVGKHISAGGFDFYHRDAIPHRRAIAWIEGQGGIMHALLLELSWCRFNKQGWYEHGGRFLKVLSADSSTLLAS